MTEPLERVRALLMAYPDMVERPSHGEPAWFHKGKKQVATYAGHHHDDRVALWCAAPPGAQEAYVGSDPERYFRPPYVGSSGWLGVYLDVDVDWPEVERILADAYRVRTAPRPKA